MTDGVHADLADVIATLPLIDHHVHGVLQAELDRPGFEALITESAWPSPPGTSAFDSPVGFAIRRHCAPLLGLPAHAGPDEYVAGRRALGAAEVNRRLLAGSGVDRLLIDTGHRASEITSPAETAAIAGQAVAEVVRLESVAEEVAVGLKSVVAYRFGLDFDPSPPAAAEVTAAAGEWLRAIEAGERPRLTDPVLLRHGIWAGLELGLPLQFHVGYGDPDLRLHRCNPLLMTDFLEACRPRDVPVLLLHCYPYHRAAGYLAQIFPHVYFDVGEAVNYTGARSRAVLAESLELAPFGKMLFSSDGWGPAELHCLGAQLWRRGMAAVLGEFVAAGDWSARDAVRVAAMIGRDNARRVYRLEDVPARGPAVAASGGR